MQEVGRAVIESSDVDFFAHLFFWSTAAVAGTFLAYAAKGIYIYLLTGVYLLV